MRRMCLVSARQYEALRQQILPRGCRISEERTTEPSYSMRVLALAAVVRAHLVAAQDTGLFGNLWETAEVAYQLPDHDEGLCRPEQHGPVPLCLRREGVYHFFLVQSRNMQ
jgi:hypothetical protein